MKRRMRLIALLSLTTVLVACVTAQTTYFRMSYVELVPAKHSKLKAYRGEPEFEQVENMEARARAMQDEGYVMLGYSQFISPLVKSLSKSYVTKYARIKEAQHVILEQPQPGASNLHYYLATYWGEIRPDSFSLGVILSELPEEIRQKIDEEMNMVFVDHAVPYTAATRAGIQTGDVIYTFNGERMTRVNQVLENIDRNKGKAITLQVLRKGETLDLPVQLTEPVARGTNEKILDFSVAPWTRTEPTDWSSLSITAIAQANIRTWQRMEQQRQVEAARARAAAQSYLASLDTTSNPVGTQISPRVDPRAHDAMKAASAWMAKEQGRKQLETMNIWFGNLQPIYGISRF